MNQQSSDCCRCCVKSSHKSDQMAHLAKTDMLLALLDMLFEPSMETVVDSIISATTDIYVR